MYVEDPPISVRFRHVTKKVSVKFGDLHNLKHPFGPYGPVVFRKAQLGEFVVVRQCREHSVWDGKRDHRNSYDRRGDHSGRSNSSRI